MSGDGYGLYVALAYGATALIVGALIWATLAANARTRAALDALEAKR